MSLGLQQSMNEMLQELVATEGYEIALVCTDEGLLMASSSDDMSSEELAGLTSLFDDIVNRAHRDLSMQRVDEVTMLDAGRGRLVIRPLLLGGAQRFFLVVRIPVKATWRRTTNLLSRKLVGMLAPLAVEA